MPSLGTSRSRMENLLRTVYLRKWRRLFNLDSVLSQIFARQGLYIKRSDGKEISVPIPAAGGAGHMWTSTGALGAPAVEAVERATFRHKMMTNRIELDVDFVESADDTNAAEMKPLDLTIESIVKNSRHDLNFDMYGDGTAILADPVSATATTLVVSSTRGLRNGLRVDVIKRADGTTGQGIVGAEIRVNLSTKTITLLGGAVFPDAGADITANPSLYAVYRAGSRNDAIFGLQAIVNNVNPSIGSYGGIDRSVSANDFWNAVVLENGGSPRAPEPELVAEAIDEVSIRSQGRTKIILAGHAVYRAMVSRLVRDKRYDGKQFKFHDWAEAIDFAGIPIVKDKHCPQDQMFGLDPDTFEISQKHEGKWMDSDGAILSRMENKVAYQAAYHRSLQIVCIDPGSNWVIKDLEYTGVAA